MYDEGQDIIDVEYNDLDNNEHSSNINLNTNKKKNFTTKKIIIFAVIFGIVAGVVFKGVSIISDKIFGDKSSITISTTKSVNNSGKSNSDVSKVASECLPSIVSITNMTIQEVQGFYSFFYGEGEGKQYEQKSAGSGIIIGKSDSELLIATNNHVVTGATTLTVSFYGNEEKPVNALLKGTAADKDLAVIAVKISDVDENTLKNIKVATMGDSTKLQIGEQAIAIGNALGYGTSVTAGIISALNRTIKASSSSSTSNFFDFFGGNDNSASQTQEETEINGKFIQTDAAINPGNSGGALLNSKGEVIGINSAKIVSESAEGIGYAIPISDARPIIEDLMSKKTREVVAESERGYLGISCKEVDSNTSKSYGMPKGIYIAEVTKDGGCAKAGLQKGDIITKIEGDEVDTYNNMQHMLSYYKIGEEIKVTYSRVNEKGEYKEKEVKVTLTKKPEK